ncbi:hypothetical protein TNCV_4027361 [Trichonephila clavipes]|nr:hypothetical protein TNCV_4027361 [Trichonephila clavipes]
MELLKIPFDGVQVIEVLGSFSPQDLNKTVHPPPQQRAMDPFEKTEESSRASLLKTHNLIGVFVLAFLHFELLTNIFETCFPALTSAEMGELPAAGYSGMAFTPWVTLLGVQKTGRTSPIPPRATPYHNEAA